jgi:hypothetical protein
MPAVLRGSGLVVVRWVHLGMSIVSVESWAVDVVMTLTE